MTLPKARPCQPSYLATPQSNIHLNNLEIRVVRRQGRCLLPIHRYHTFFRSPIWYTDLENQWFARRNLVLERVIERVNGINDN